MKTIFGLFRTYPEAEPAVHELLHRRFKPEQMNVLVQSGAADVHPHAEPARPQADVAERLGIGLDTMLAPKRPVTVPGVGNVYAAGTLAGLVVKTAALPGAAGDGLQAALVDLGVPADVARTYADGVGRGGVLFWIRVDDEEAPKAANMLRNMKAVQVGSYAG